jgi:hypothetical protein
VVQGSTLEQVYAGNGHLQSPFSEQFDAQGKIKPVYIMGHILVQQVSVPVPMIISYDEEPLQDIGVDLGAQCAPEGTDIHDMGIVPAPDISHVAVEAHLYIPGKGVEGSTGRQGRSQV